MYLCAEIFTYPSLPFYLHHEKHIREDLEARSADLVQSLDWEESLGASSRQARMAAEISTPSLSVW